MQQFVCSSSLSHNDTLFVSDVAVSAAKDAAGQVDLNKAMEYKAKFDELTSDESNKKED